ELERVFFRAVLGADVSGSERFEILHGALLADTLAYRVTEVATTEPQAIKGALRGLRTTKSADMGLYLALLVDFADSAASINCTFDPSGLPFQIAQHSTWLMTVTALDTAIADKIDRELKSDPAYYGCMQIDTGNRLQLYLLVEALPKAYVYMDRRLGFVSYEWDCGECEYPLRHDDWWAELPFDSVSWFRQNGQGRGLLVGERSVTGPVSGLDYCDEPPQIIPSALSARGKKSSDLYKNGRLGTPVQRAVEALSLSLVGRKSAESPPDVAVSADRLPDAEHAEIRPEKLRDYALNPGHPTGKDKAAMFSNILAIGPEDWEHLADQLSQGLGRGEVERVRVNPDGTVLYHVHSPVVGLNGTVATVLSAWLVRPDAPPTLTTTYPERSSHEFDWVPQVRVVTGAERGTDEYWVRLHDAAHLAGELAAKAVVPKPMFVQSQYPLGANIGNPEAVAEGEFGYAYAVIDDGLKGFGRWLSRNHGAEWRARKREAWLPARINSSSAARTAAYAGAYTQVLHLNHVRSRAECRLD
ncbi:MAG: DUF6883 domain-containing protein, partial [Coriobacteriia bacterium]